MTMITVTIVVLTCSQSLSSHHPRARPLLRGAITMKILKIRRMISMKIMTIVMNIMTIIKQQWQTWEGERIAARFLCRGVSKRKRVGEPIGVNIYYWIYVNINIHIKYSIHNTNFNIAKWNWVGELKWVRHTRAAKSQIQELTFC